MVIDHDKKCKTEDMSYSIVHALIGTTIIRISKEDVKCEMNRNDNILLLFELI
jgi:hypothetical protein